MSERNSVRSWNKDALQAASMKCGACEDAIGLVGITNEAVAVVPRDAPTGLPEFLRFGA